MTGGRSTDRTRRPTSKAVPSAKTERPPATVATERLAKLVNSGAGPDHLTLQTQLIVTTWEEEAATPGEYADRLETVRAELEEGLEVAETQVLDMNPEERAALARAKTGLEAIRASLVVVKAALENAI